MPPAFDTDALRSARERIAEAREGCPFVDAHVHPFDVLVGGQRYHPETDGVYGAFDATYRPPRLEKVLEDPAGSGTAGSPSSDIAARFFLLSVRRLYAHTGPAVLADHLDLAGIERCLLLPVAGTRDDGHFRRMISLFGDDPRFVLGYCAPDEVATDRIVGAVGRAVADHGVRVLKIHPGVQGIDVRTRGGMERVEGVLDASRIHGLGVVVHGGLSPYTPHHEAVTFGSLAHLARVDWSITPQPVVIAHAGAFGVPGSDVASDVLPDLERLLGAHGHLDVDVAGLGLDAMRALLSRVPVKRVLFGSDALYYSPFETLVRLVHALEQNGLDVYEGLRRIAGVNPLRIVGKPGKATCGGC